MNSTLNEPGLRLDGGKPRPELAVLFHLVDVSRPRTAPRPDQVATLSLDGPSPLQKTAVAAANPGLSSPLAPSGVPGQLPSIGEQPRAKDDAQVTLLSERSAPQYSLAGIKPT